MPSGNGIAVSQHWSVKRVVSREQCIVMEAVYWYNVTLKDDLSSTTTSASAVFTYLVRIKGIGTTTTPTPVYEEVHGPYKVGDPV